MLSSLIGPDLYGARGPLRRTASLLTLGLLATACTTPSIQQVAPEEIPLVLGPPVRDNVTPMEGVLACFADHLAAAGERPVVIGVGDVKDYTGKYSINEGNAITQGGALMVYSALGKMTGAVRVAERFDPSVAERELGYTDRRQLGDGSIHELGGANGTQQVPWLPYFGGTIQKSDYFIVGGITEVNYDINSGGFDAGVNQMAAKARTYSQQVAIDLRIVDTKTLMVVKTVSLAKQFTGYEVGAGIFRFFDSDLFDISIGARGQEPIQLGVRATIEEGVMRLVSAVTQVDYRPCSVAIGTGGRYSEVPAEQLRTVANPPSEFAAPVVRAQSAPVVNNGSSAPATAGGGGEIQIAFEFGSAQLGGDALSRLDAIAAAAQQGGVVVLVTSRDTENYDPGQRDALTNQRIAAITSALASRGIAPAAVRVIWRPEPSDSSIHRDGPGLQELARLRVGG
jgi:curli biogenesis system outer membrane secretion channel CsgG